MTEEQARRAEQIVKRWLWAARLSVSTDRAVEQAVVGELAVALLDQLVGDRRRADAFRSGARAA
jgi:hypothetical protein